MMIWTVSTLTQENWGKGNGVIACRGMFEPGTAWGMEYPLAITHVYEPPQMPWVAVGREWGT